MAYSLASAAAAAGINKSTVLRAIKAGRVSAQRDANNQWAIEPAEFHRGFPPLPLPATGPQRDAHQDAMADALVAELRATISDLRGDRDHWRTAFENAQRQIPAQPQQSAPLVKRRVVWGWVRPWRRAG